jgi:t-SNARE complex subunit (syntaxin)
VTELKAIFLDFAQLVRDQQAGIDEIEKNIDAVRLLKTCILYSCVCI